MLVVVLLLITLISKTQFKKIEPVLQSYAKIENATAQDLIENSGGQLFQTIPVLRGDEKINRILDLAQTSKSPLDEYGIRNAYIVSQILGINPTVPFCIAQADSQIGRAGKAFRTKNPCNLGNTDGGGTKHFKTFKDGMEACVRQLVKPQYRSTDLLGELSNGGRALLGLPMDSGNWSKGDKVWATSKENHIINMLRCVREVEQNPNIDVFYKFK